MPRKKTLFSPFVLWPLNLNESCKRSQRQPLPLRGPVSKNKTTPLTEMANYSVWPLLEYLMIFTSRQKCPGVIELPPWTFIGVTAASPTTCRRKVKQATIVCSAGASESKRDWFLNWGCESMLSCTGVCCRVYRKYKQLALQHSNGGKMVRCCHSWASVQTSFTEVLWHHRGQYEDFSIRSHLKIPSHVIEEQNIAVEALRS